jgi:preprotein translocase subunit SecE
MVSPGRGAYVGPALGIVFGKVADRDHGMATSPFKFFQEVREETRKVTWPSRKETAITTAMVFVMVAIASVFFLVADQIMRIAVTFVLGIAG